MNCARSRIGMYALIVCANLVPLFSFAHKIVTSGAETEVVATEKGIVILQVADPIPNSAVKLNTAEISGDKNAASYKELLESARLLAMKSDANIIKITERSTRNKANIYDQLKVTFYKAENPRLFEREFAWTSARKLTWEDFRGPQQPAMGEDVAAATFCGIGFETNTISSLNPELKVNVYNTFYTNKSWVREGLEKPEILAHEQCHFDICELYTRKLRERMGNVKVSVETLKTTLRSIYTELQKEYIQRQEQYEEETGHGVVADEQARWQKMIAMELEKTQQWKSE